MLIYLVSSAVLVCLWGSLAFSDSPEQPPNTQTLSQIGVRNLKALPFWLLSPCVDWSLLRQQIFTFRGRKPAIQPLTARLQFYLYHMRTWLPVCFWHFHEPNDLFDFDQWDEMYIHHLGISSFLLCVYVMFLAPTLPDISRCLLFFWWARCLLFFWWISNSQLLQ